MAQDTSDVLDRPRNNIVFHVSFYPTSEEFHKQETQKSSNK